MNPLDICNISDEKESRTREESSVLDDVANAELKKLISNKLPVELRATYLQMLAGESITKAKRMEVREAILKIFKETDSCLLSAVQ